MQPEKLPQFFHDRLLFSQICSFLSTKEILNLCTVSKQVRDIIESYCKNVLLGSQLHTLSNKSAIHRLQFYYNRCLTVEGDKKPIVTFVEPFKFQVIRFFEVGSLYACYLTNKQKAIIFKTSSLLEQPPVTQYQTKNNVQHVSCKSQKAILTKSCGEVTLLSTDKLSPHIIEFEEIIKWTTIIPIAKVESSFNYAIFLPRQKTSLSDYLNYVFKTPHKPNPNEEKNTYLVVKNMLKNTEHIVCVPCRDVIDCTVGHKSAFFISDTYECYGVDFDPNAEEEIFFYAEIFVGLAGKTICKVVNGYNFFVALERNTERLENWDNQRVLRWLREIGLGDFIKIAKVEKIDGKKLCQMDRKYMNNVLGITKQNMQQKFIMSIQQHTKDHVNKDQLYGWGKNCFGQLGSDSANYIAKPQKIKFNLPENEYIDSIFCGWFQTFVRTQKGRIFCTVTKNQKAKKKQRQGSRSKQKTAKQIKLKGYDSSDNEIQVSIKKNQKKKKVPERDRQKKKVKKQKRFEESQYWYESQLGKSFFVQTFKDNIFYIQCRNQNKEEHNRHKKLRTARSILDKIFWSHLNKEQFQVGYLDKDMGLIKASAYQMEMFDVKENRIKYIKRNGEIIWDRENKIDIL